MSRTYRKLDRGENPDWTTDFVFEDIFSLNLNKVIRRSTKEERARSVRDGGQYHCYHNKANHHYYFNITRRKFRTRERREYSRIKRCINYEDFDFDDFKQQKYLKGIWWVIY